MSLILAPAGSSRLQEVAARHRAFWAGEGMLRSAGVHTPSLPVSLPQRDGSRLSHAERLTPDMIDPDAMIAEIEALDLAGAGAAGILAGQYMAYAGRGDTPPHTCPFSKIPWMEAILGCPIKMTEGQIWAEHYPGDPQEIIDRGANVEHNPWFQLYVEFMRQLNSRLSRRFVVTPNTLLRGVSDLVAAIMGVQEACLGWLDQPAFMARLLRVCADALLSVWEAGYKLARPAFAGYASSWGLFAPAPIVDTQADHSSLLSPATYRRHILPFDLEIVRCCPYSLFHLHNNGLHIAPLLIEAPEISVIEVFLDPYPAGERKAWDLQMVRLIQQHKPLVLNVNFPSYAEYEWLLGQIEPRRLLLDVRFSPDAALPADLPGSETWVLA